MVGRAPETAAEKVRVTVLNLRTICAIMKKMLFEKGSNDMAKEMIRGANPFMPLWEHVPDGEPRVFEFNGEKRVFLYGSHDMQPSFPCGTNYVVWSAPEKDLTSWTYHGVCYNAPDANPMFAPDVVKKGDTYYLYAAERCNGRITVSKSKSPIGPFTDAVVAEVGSDVGVFVDDDGRAYAYWGYCNSFCAELNDDMATVKKETLRTDYVKCFRREPFLQARGETRSETGFYEAASMRKINGKYVLIYSKCYTEGLEEYGVQYPCNMFLSYKYADSPLGEFCDGGDICYNCGEIIKDRSTRTVPTYQYGNNHGSLACLQGQWYVFYHRHTNGPQGESTGRQAMLEPVDVAFDKGGRPFIGKITYKDGEPISAKPVEMTSQGPHLQGLDAYKHIRAAYTCHISGDNTAAYVSTPYYPIQEGQDRVTNINDKTVVGFKYLQFGSGTAKSVSVRATGTEQLTVKVRKHAYDGEIIAVLQIPKGAAEASAPLLEEVSGKHAIYFEFLLSSSGARADFYSFDFDA